MSIADDGAGMGAPAWVRLASEGANVLVGRPSRGSEEAEEAAAKGWSVVRVPDAILERGEGSWKV